MKKTAHEIRNTTYESEYLITVNFFDKIFYDIEKAASEGKFETVETQPTSRIAEQVKDELEDLGYKVKINRGSLNDTMIISW